MTDAQSISIHALLAESDHSGVRIHFPPSTFLSTLSLRRATLLTLCRFLPCRFLSTLSLRRATHYDNYNLHCVEISIHALLAESDWKRFPPMCITRHFYPRSPCGERPLTLLMVVILISFLSTLSLRRATHYDNYNLHCVEISIHALLAESDQ